MKQIFLLFILLLAMAGPTLAAEQVVMETSMGNIVLELDSKKAPVSVENFLGYVDSKSYDGTIFHRVIDNFMIQGGGFDEQMNKKKTGSAIINEANNGLLNDKGTIAMARTQVVDSATNQFFINLKDNDFLNHQGNSSRTYGYAVFGRVIEGMDVVNKIGKVSTIRKGGHQNVPQPAVIIKQVRRVTTEK